MQEGTVAVTKVANALLCMYSKPDVGLGLIKTKVWHHQIGGTKCQKGYEGMSIGLWLITYQILPFLLAFFKVRCINFFFNLVYSNWRIFPHILGRSSCWILGTAIATSDNMKTENFLILSIFSKTLDALL